MSSNIFTNTGGLYHPSMFQNPFKEPRVSQFQTGRVVLVNNETWKRYPLSQGGDGDINKDNTFKHQDFKQYVISDKPNFFILKLIP